jgi:hypothetical protein
MLGDIPKVTLEEFGIVPSLVDGCLVLQLTGTGDIVAVEPLRNCLGSVQGKVQLKEISSVEFDIRRLLLLNSSCLKLFASFLLELMSMKANCPIHFIVDSKSAWQARSLFALERLAGDIVRIVPR